MRVPTSSDVEFSTYRIVIQVIEVRNPVAEAPCGAVGRQKWAKYSTTPKLSAESKHGSQTVRHVGYDAWARSARKGNPPAINSTISRRATSLRRSTRCRLNRSITNTTAAPASTATEPRSASLSHFGSSGPAHIWSGTITRPGMSSQTKKTNRTSQQMTTQTSIAGGPYSGRSRPSRMRAFWTTRRKFRITHRGDMCRE